MLNIPLPTEKISPKAIMVWRIRDAIFYGIIVLILGVLLFAAYYYSWFDWVRILLLIVTGLAILQSLYKLTVHPVLLYKTWRYSMDEQYIQIQHGLFHTFHTIIPMSRVQNVNTSQGPILRKFRLAKVTIRTITTAIDIPEIPEEAAKVLREQIIHYTRTDTTETVEQAYE